MPPFWQGGLQTPGDRSNKRVHVEYSRDSYLSMSGIVKGGLPGGPKTEEKG